MVLTSHQLGRTFTDSLRDPAAQKTVMVQKELKQVEVRAAELAPQRKVVGKNTGFEKNRALRQRVLQ